MRYILVDNSILKFIDDLNAIKRPVFNFDECYPTDDYSSIFDENPRGSGFLFSFDAVANFLNENLLKRLIRAYKCVRCFWEFDRLVVQFVFQVLFWKTTSEKDEKENAK